MSGCVHTEQGTACIVPATYDQKCHFQEQNLGGRFKFTHLSFVQTSLTFHQSPMCQYSAERGHATDWHLVHLGVRSV